MTVDERLRRDRSRAALLVLGILASAFLVGMPQAAHAATVTTTIDGVTYAADDADIGAGATVTDYTGSDPDVILPDAVDIGGTLYDVTAIGTRAFDSAGLTSIELPDTLITIGERAFLSNDLTSLVIPDSVTTIGDSAFLYNAITSLTLSDSLVSIGNSAFASSQLTELTLPDSLVTIGNGAFSNNSLTSLVIPSAVTTIGSNAFIYNDLTELTLPNSLVTIGNGAFASNALTDVVIPDSVTAIGSDTFIYNDLTAVTLPDSLLTIGNGAFASNALTEVVIPGAVTTIGSNAFIYNDLTELTLPNSLVTIGNGAFASNALTDVVIPGAVTTIGSSAFLYNSALSTVRFEGNAPTISPATSGGSFGSAAGKALYFLPGATGFTTPTWQGYTTYVQYTVTFDTGVGSVVDPVYVGGGELLPAPADPTRSGYDFTGWYTDAAGTVAYNFSDPVVSDLTLYAGWAPVPALAPTGVDVEPAIALGAVLSVLGGALLLGHRRRIASGR